MRNCLGCKYAKWSLTKIGRLHPSGDGACSYKYKIPPLPASMYFVNNPSPSGGYINRNENFKDHCPYWQE